MAEKTGIAWTDHTFNPWWGCFKVSPGCKNCYAETFSNRTGHDVWGPAATTERRTFGHAHWREPFKWNEHAKKNGRARVFCASMADVFEDHPTANAERPKLWGIIRETPLLDWQILTKRPENIAAMLPDDWGAGYRNVWLGTSVEDQQRANERIPELLKVPAQTRFLSCEPLLGPVDLLHVEYPGSTFGTVDVLRRGSWTASSGFVNHSDMPELHWIIVGGESGGARRPMEVAWLRAIVNDCYRAAVAVFVKQDNAFKPDQQGRIPDELFVREFPKDVNTRSGQRPKEEGTHLGGTG